MAERREDSRGNNSGDKEENSMQQQSNVKLIGRLLRLGISESEIREAFREFVPPQETFEEARAEFTKRDMEYSSNEELPQQELAHLKQNTIEAIAEFDMLAHDESKTAVEKGRAGRLRTQCIEYLHDIVEAEKKFSDPYEAFNAAMNSRRRRYRAEQADSFANEVEKLLENQRR